MGPDAKLIRDTLLRGHADKLDAILVAHSHFGQAMDCTAAISRLGSELFGFESPFTVGLSANFSER